MMRLTILTLAAILTCASVRAQEPVPASPPQDTVTSTEAAAPVLPVSLDRIRKALALPGYEPLRVLDEKPMFRVEVRERQRLDELLTTLNYDAGPTPRGGTYAFEQQRQLFNPVQNPFAQPYAAFSQPELVTILAEEFFQKLLGRKLLQSVAGLSRARDEQSAREEVDRALAQYLSGVR